PDEAAGGAGGPTVVRAVRPGRPRLVGLGTARTRPRVPPGRRGGQRQRDRALAGVVLGGRPRVPRRAGVLVGGCPGVFVGGCPGVLVGGCPGVFVGVRVAVDLVPLRDGGRSGPGAGADRGRPALVLGRHVGEAPDALEGVGRRHPAGAGGASGGRAVAGREGGVGHRFEEGGGEHPGRRAAGGDGIGGPSGDLVQRAEVPVGA